MVETKFSVLDTQEITPLVSADHFVHQNDALSSQAIQSATTALISDSQETKTCQGDDIPIIPTEEGETNSNRVVGAGVASGVFGFLVGGPIVALIFGFTAAYAAENKDGVVGDTARAVGDLALSTKAKAKEIDEKHHLVEKTKQAAADAWQKAKEIDREHHVLDKAREVLVTSWVATSDFVRRHNLVERGMNAVGTWVCWALEKILPEQPRQDRLNENQNNRSQKK